jgi:hypothetical protein
MVEKKNNLKKQLKNLQDQNDLFLNLSSSSLVLLAQFISIDENLTQNVLQVVNITNLT